MNEAIKYCTKCGTQNHVDASFCRACGNQFAPIPSSTRKNVSLTDSATAKLNSWLGDEGAVDIKFKDFFSQVFKKHTEQEAEDKFAVGTSQTTPTLAQITEVETHPWLFARILGFILILCILMFILSNMNSRSGITVTLAVLLAVAVPFAGLILFFETNLYKDISFYKVMIMMCLGGTLSLIVTMILTAFMPYAGNSLNAVNATLTGITEELAKVFVAAFFLERFKVKKILTGLLIGASIGSGFAIFENIMYLFDDHSGQLLPIEFAVARAITSIADHTEWCAITTVALVLVMQGRRFSIDQMLNNKFLRLFGLTAAIHALWDWDFFTTSDVLLYGHLAVLIALTWVIILVIMHAGLKEISEDINQLQQKS